MKRILRTLLLSVLSGVLITIGCVVNLLLLPEARFLGAFLFSAGLFFICELQFKLFTGAVGYALDNDIKSNLELPIILLGNGIGVAITSLLVSLTRIYEQVYITASVVIETKLNDTWYSILVLAILCGILIYLGVETYKRSNNNFAKILGIIFCVMVFIMISAEHCIANIGYFILAKSFTLKGFLYFLLMVFGNSIGGVFIPLFTKLIKLLNEKKDEA